MTPIETMLSVLAAWTARDVEGALAHLHDDIVWHYAAAVAPPIRGRAQARRFLDGFSAQIQEVRWRIFDYAEREGRLFVEGVDEYVDVDGRLVSAPYAGVLEFRDGKIIAWRDYFDSGVVNALKDGAEASPHLRTLIAREALGQCD
jgi:limonene-1,2-epoxide hydrolase